MIVSRQDACDMALKHRGFLRGGICGLFPADETANIHDKKNGIRDDEGVTMGQNAEDGPATVANHHGDEARFIFIAQQVNRG